MEVVKVSKEQTSTAFEPHSLSSSSMDNVPLKALMGASNNLKNHQSSSQDKKVGHVESCTRITNDSVESTRSKLRDSLASALAMVVDEQSKKDLLSGDNMHMQLIVYGNTDEKTLPVDSQKILKRSRDEFECNEANSVSSNDTNREVNLLQMNPDVSKSNAAMPEDSVVSGEINLDDKKKNEDSHKDDRAQIVAIQIEDQLFRKYGGVSKKYKERARSLLFNLKDKNNPELRARVFSGEITPEELCCMSAEQLASKELSQWRIAKAEELDHMKMLPASDTEFRRLVKKTHKGEYQVEVGNDDAIPEVPADDVNQSKSDRDHHLVMEPSDVGNTFGDPKTSDHSGNFTNAPDHLPPPHSVQVAGLTTGERDSVESGLPAGFTERGVLPEILSLDEYIGAKRKNLNQESEGDEIKMDDSTYLANTYAGYANENDVVDDSNNQSVHYDSFNASKKHFSDVNGYEIGNEALLSSEKVWEGTIQMNPSTVQSVVALFKSGEKTSTRDWSTYIEVKGRVRLDAFEKFLQELPLSRSRTVMVVLITCRNILDLANIQEVSISYKQSERVGYAEPAPGVELYLCPPDATTFKILNRYITYEVFEGLNEMDGLIGCVVWRRNNVTFNFMQKTPERSTKIQEYVNAKRLPVSGHIIESPTTPEELNSRPYTTETQTYVMGTGFENHHVQDVSRNHAIQNDQHVESVLENNSSDLDAPPGFDPSSFSNANSDNDPRMVFPTSVNDDILSDDVPPGFGPEPVHQLTPRPGQNLDDDDLPEFDYNGEPLSYQCPQLSPSPGSDIDPLHSTRAQIQSSQPSNLLEKDARLQSKETLQPAKFPSVNQKAIPQPSSRANVSQTPSQIRELIKKFGHSDSNSADSAPNNPVISPLNKTLSNHYDNSIQTKFALQSRINMHPVNVRPYPQPRGNHQMYPPRGISSHLPPFPMAPLPVPMPNQRSQFMHLPPQMSIGRPLAPHPMPPPPVAPRFLTGIARPAPIMMANNSPRFWNVHHFRSGLSGPDARPFYARDSI